MGSPRYIRITKRHARERWDAGLPIRLCPCKFMPGGGFAMDMLIQNTPQHQTYGRTFEDMVREFCNYNANCDETGYYAAYYITSDMEPEPFQMMIREKVRASRRVQGVRR